MTAAPVAVLACGNPSRGDDAIGPILLARLEGWLAEHGLARHFELIEDFQFQVEHALDLVGRRTVLFIDAGERTPGPFELAPVFADPTPGHSTHAITPAAVLAVHERVTGSTPPPAWLLCIRGESFELGDPPGAAALDNLEAAWSALRDWCRVAIA